MELIIELAARFAEEKGAYRLLVRNKICNTFKININNLYCRLLIPLLPFSEPIMPVVVSSLNDNKS